MNKFNLAPWLVEAINIADTNKLLLIFDKKWREKNKETNELVERVGFNSAYIVEDNDNSLLNFLEMLDTMEKNEPWDPNMAYAYPEDILDGTDLEKCTRNSINRYNNLKNVDSFMKIFNKLN
jgi:hypothetical protein